MFSSFATSNRKTRSLWRFVACGVCLCCDWCKKIENKVYRKKTKQTLNAMKLCERNRTHDCKRMHRMAIGFLLLWLQLLLFLLFVWPKSHTVIKKTSDFKPKTNSTQTIKIMLIFLLFVCLSVFQWITNELRIKWLEFNQPMKNRI